MLFTERKSSLVRLSDCIKIGLAECLYETKQLIDLQLKYSSQLDEMRRIAQMALDGQISYDEAEAVLRKNSQKIPENEAIVAVTTQGTLHSKSLSVVLNCCFCLESYINSLAYHLFRETDFLGLIRSGHDISAEILMEAIDKMSTMSKWEAVGRLRNGCSFDKSKSPFQDFKYLFNFRNDVVHDKAIEYEDERPRKRYGGKLPDPVLGFLDLSHSIFAAHTYWGMVCEIHRLISLDMRSFHKQYNLSPWSNDEFRAEIERTATEYRKITIKE